MHGCFLSGCFPFLGECLRTAIPAVVAGSKGSPCTPENHRVQGFCHCCGTDVLRLICQLAVSLSVLIVWMPELGDLFQPYGRNLTVCISSPFALHTTTSNSCGLTPVCAFPKTCCGWVSFWFSFFLVSNVDFFLSQCSK